MLQAVADIHSKNIVHRDIKPENVLLKSSNKVDGGRKVCLADFGIACLITDETLSRQLCGTPGYIDPFILNPPEIPQEKGMQITLRSDIFSVGSIFYWLITGKPLVKGDSIEELLLNNKNIFIELD